MSQDVKRNRKLFLKEAVKAKGGKIENCCRIKGRTGKLVVEPDAKRETWKDILRICIQSVCGFESDRGVTQ